MIFRTQFPQNWRLVHLCMSWPVESKLKLKPRGSQPDTGHIVAIDNLFY